jgi:hypothetical protein
MGNAKSQQEKSEYQAGCFYEALEIQDCYLGRYKVLKNTLRQERLYFSKQLHPEQYDSYQADVDEFSGRLTQSYHGFCDFHFIDPNPYNPDAYDMVFEYGSCLTVLQNEQSLWSFINDITVALRALEMDGTHYPVIRKKYACFNASQKCFKLLNPFSFDSYNDDLMRIYLNPSVTDQDKALFLRTKINKSVRELGITILALASGLEEAHIVQNPGFIKGKLDSMEQGYSSKLTSLLRFLVETRGELSFADVRVFVEKGGHPLYRASVKRGTMSERNFGPQYYPQDQWAQSGRNIMPNGVPMPDPRYYSVNNLAPNGFPQGPNPMMGYDFQEPTSIRNHPNFNSVPTQQHAYTQGFPLIPSSPVLTKGSQKFNIGSDLASYQSTDQMKRPGLYRPMTPTKNIQNFNFQAPPSTSREFIDQDPISKTSSSPKPLDQYLDNYSQSTGAYANRNNQFQSNSYGHDRPVSNQASNTEFIRPVKMTSGHELKSEFKITDSEILTTSNSPIEENTGISPVTKDRLSNTSDSKDPLKLKVPNNTPRTTVDDPRMQTAPVVLEPKIQVPPTKVESKVQPPVPVKSLDFNSPVETKNFVTDFTAKKLDTSSDNIPNIDEPSSPKFPEPVEVPERESPEPVKFVEEKPVSQQMIVVEEKKQAVSNPKGLKVVKVRMRWQSDKNCHVEVVEYEDGSTEERPPRDQAMLKMILDNFLRKREEEKTNEPAQQHVPKKSAMHQYDVTSLAPKSEIKTSQTLDSFCIRLFCPEPEKPSRLIYTSELKEVFDSFSEMMRIVDTQNEIRPSVYHNVEADYFDAQVTGMRWKADRTEEKAEEIDMEREEVQKESVATSG